MPNISYHKDGGMPQEQKSTSIVDCSSDQIANIYSNNESAIYITVSLYEWKYCGVQILFVRLCLSIHPFPFSISYFYIFALPI